MINSYDISLVRIIIRIEGKDLGRIVLLEIGILFSRGDILLGRALFVFY